MPMLINTLPRLLDIREISKPPYYLDTPPLPLPLRFPGTEE